MCHDVDECENGTHRCDANAQCINTLGSLKSTCNSRFSGDGQVCHDVDEFLNGFGVCSSTETCSNNEGSYTCSCNEGLHGNGRICKCKSGFHGQGIYVIRELLVLIFLDHISALAIEDILKMAQNEKVSKLY